MSFLDRAKDFATEHAEQARDFAADHAEQVKGGIEKAGDFVDDKTGGKYAEHVDTVQEKAGEYVEKGKDQA